MSLLTPLLPHRPLFLHRPQHPHPQTTIPHPQTTLPNPRTTAEALIGVPTAVQEWHVGLSPDGMFPHREASCPCAKAPCGLVIPRPDVFCTVHQGPFEYRRLHIASECGFPRKFRLRQALKLNR